MPKEYLGLKLFGAQTLTSTRMGLFGDQPLYKSEAFGVIVRLSILGAFSFFSLRWILNQVDPTVTQKKKAIQKANKVIKRLDLSIKKQLNDYEMVIASHLVDPREITVTWKDIAGLEEVIQEIQDTVILPIQRRELFCDSQLTQPPKGVLLYGPPGCGKTLIAKATAKEAGTRFINLDVSVLTDKWYGESQKLAAAVFTLAVKIQPCIVFIDEIDAFLRMRASQDHEATAMMKAQFMSFWDGLITDDSCTVIIMGATNRPFDLDKAILRRMPSRFNICLPVSAVMIIFWSSFQLLLCCMVHIVPTFRTLGIDFIPEDGPCIGSETSRLRVPYNAADLNQRLKILKLILNKEPLADDVDFEALSQHTVGFSGSDIRELCRNASLYRIRDFNRNATRSANEDEFHDALRPITMDDLLCSIRKFQESKFYSATGFYDT